MAVNGMSLGTQDPRSMFSYPTGQNYSSGSRAISNTYDQSKDYGDIMAGYDSLLNDAKTNRNTKLNYVPLNPIFSQYTPGAQYSRSADLDKTISGFKNFADTGGYSDADIGNIRERSISPIRSIYSSAQEGLRRQKVLSGGYSPNYGAVSAKMARDASSRIGDITTNVNAEIAKMIQAGKLAGLQGLSPLTMGENERINDTAQRNQDILRDYNSDNTNESRRVATTNNANQLDVDKFNRTTESNFNPELSALSGKTSLYGTTPAITQQMMNDVLNTNQQNLQAISTANAIKDQRANIGLNLVNSQLRPGGATFSRGF